MFSEKADQPQLFKDVVLNALLSDKKLTKLCSEEPFNGWNVQVTANFLGGRPKKIEITRISRVDK